MNKMMGFYELKHSDLPTINWKEYTGIEILSDEFLWTIRTAVLEGNDFNLPRFVGVNASDGNKNLKELYETFKNKGMVIFYPFFIAKKSGTLNVFNNKVVIEAVKDDLWNLVTYSDVDVTIIQNLTDNSIEFIGNRDFLSQNEISLIMSNVSTVKRMFRDYLIEGKSILLEWSFAFNCNKDGMMIGDKYLVFYEVRTV